MCAAISCLNDPFIHIKLEKDINTLKKAIINSLSQKVSATVKEPFNLNQQHIQSKKMEN